jgi:ABC-type transport system substrate-binding protein
MRIRARIAGGLLALACVACSRAGEPRQAHVLRIADWPEPTSLNPLLAHDQDTIGLDLLFCQTLVGLSHDNKLVSILLRRVPTRANGDLSADGKTIVYRLRPDVRFADGQPLTSRDVVFTYRAVMDPRNPVLSQDAYRCIAALAAPGPLRTGRFNIASQGWIGGGDPEQSVTFACSQIGPDGNNISRYCDRRFEAAFEDQAVTRDERRASDFRTMQQIVYRDLPAIPLDYLRYFDAVNVRVTGFARSMLGFPINAPDWDVK